MAKLGSGRWASFALSLVIGAGGGITFAALGTPLPYMLGAMAFSIAAAFAGVPLTMPAQARLCIIPVLGVMFGSVLDIAGVPTGPILVALTGLVVVYLLATISLGWLFFTRAGYDPVTSYFAAVPGNLSEVASLADDYGGNLRLIVLAHSARIAITITVISFGLRYVFGLDVVSLVPKAGPSPGAYDYLLLLGCAIGGLLVARAVRMPSAPLLGPMLAGVAVHASGLTAAAPPPLLVAAAQVALGILVGARFSGMNLREVGRPLAISAAWALILLAIIAIYVLIASNLLAIDYPAMLLASTPGGLAEASALAIAAHLSLGFVTAVQIIRILCVLVIGPQIIKRIFPHKPHDKTKP